MIAGKKFFDRIKFFNDYGVDVGIIDTFDEARIKKLTSAI
jgi:hypothetical protein